MKDFDFKDKVNIVMLVLMASILLFSYVFYSYFYADYNEKLEQLTLSEQSKANRLKVIEKQVKRKDILAKELTLAQTELERLRKMFPDQEKVPLRLNDLYKIIRASGVRITKFKPGTEVAGGDENQVHYRKNHYYVSLEAGFHMLGELFEGLANLGYPISLDKMRIRQFAGIRSELDNSSQHGWTPITINVDFELITYSSRGKN